MPARMQTVSRELFSSWPPGLLDVPYDALRRRELRRSQRRWTALGATALGLSAVFALLALQATAARDEAREAQARAELELASERQTREFLVSVFESADPENARGEPITVRDALDQAVDRIDDMEFLPDHWSGRATYRRLDRPMPVSDSTAEAWRCCRIP